MLGAKKRSRGLGTVKTKNVDRRMLLTAIGGVLAIVAITLLAFGRDALFPRGTETRAIFASGTQLKGGSVVRRAGLDIGEVLKVEASKDGRALVSMRIKPDVDPIRTDSRLAIRPRLAFEGNFYVDVVGGTESASVADENVTFPMTQTSVPVQLDQVLSTFDRPIRDSSKRLVTSLATGLGAGSGPGDAATFGAEGLKQATRALAGALPSAGRVADAARGTRVGDLGEALDSTADLTGTLAKNPQELTEIVANYDTVIGRLASSDRDLAASLRAASSTLQTAPASLRKLDRMLPELTRFSTNLRPSLRELPATTKPADAAFQQLALVARKQELPALVSALDDPIRRLPSVVEQLNFALPMLAPIGRCLSQNIVPVLNKRVPDGKLSVDQPAWLEFLHAAANLTGGSPGFDGNGATFRAGLGAGSNVAVGVVPGLGRIVGGFDPDELEGVRPVWLGYDVLPSKRPDVQCDTQPVAKLESKVGVPFGGRLKSVPAPMAGMDEDEKQAATAKLLAPLQKALTSKLKPGEKAPAAPTAPKTSSAPSSTPSADGDGAKPQADTPTTAVTTPAAPAAKDPVSGLVDDALGGLSRLLGDITNPGGRR
jgi:phospholipid/cholesterol/gamma-HCH transport system substrate-binding protein